MNIIIKRIKGLDKSLKNYPYALTFSTLTTIIMIFLINMEDYYNPETLEVLGRLAMTTALGFPLFLIINSFFERNNKIEQITKFIIRVFAGLLLVGYNLFLLKGTNMVTMTRYIAVTLALYLIFLVITYFHEKKNFELYIVKIFSRILVTFIYSFILMAGISAIIFTIKELLQVPIAEIIYLSTGLIIGGIFAPIFLLAKIPHPHESINLNEYPNILKILLLYIVMPLITVYTSILYIYFIKIIMIQQLPEGIVTHLVLWYSSLSIILLFFVSPLKSKSKWVKVFTRWLPIGLIPLLLMMFLAIGIRINTYGVTESRYFVVALGLWITGVAIYYISTRKKNNIILPFTLALVILLSVFGPWSSYSVSISSQNNRFENLVNKYELVENNKIIKNETTIAQEDKEEIRAILKYFTNNHQLEEVKYLPDNFKLTDTENHFGFAYHKNIVSNQVQNYFYNIRNNKKAISIKDYDYLFHLSNQNNYIENIDDDQKVVVKNINDKIIITKNDTIIYQKSLKPILEEFYHKNKNKKEQEKIIFTDQNSDLNLKYIFNSFNISIQKSIGKDIEIRSSDFYLLVKFRNSSSD